jgi:hypothetical protein
MNRRKLMNKSETAKIIGIIQSAYPRFAFGDMELTISLWQEMFADVPLQVVIPALKKLIIESQFPPTIHDLYKRVAEVTNPEQLTASEAYGEVTKAIQKYGMYRVVEALDNLSPLTRKVVEQMDFKRICTSDEPDVVRGQFLKMYESERKREEQNRLIPQRMKEQIAQLGEKMDIRMLT